MPWFATGVAVRRGLLEAGRLGPKRGHADVARQGQSHWICLGPSRGGRLEFRMERKGQLLAAAGSVIFFGLAPGVVAGLIPWWLTGWRITNPIPVWGPMRVLGAALTVGAAIVLISAFARFVMEGVGTPAPVAPTRHLVVGGLYRYVRNPMYIAVVVAIVGQALFLGQLSLLLYAAVVGVIMAAFARWFEEPTLLERFGDEYAEYRQAVPGWWPRMRLWRRK